MQHCALGTSLYLVGLGSEQVWEVYHSPGTPNKNHLFFDKRHDVLGFFRFGTGSFSMGTPLTAIVVGDTFAISSRLARIKTVSQTPHLSARGAMI